MLSPAGPDARGIAGLWWAMLWGGTAIFVVTVGLFVLVWLRPGTGRRIAPAWWIGIGGIAFPLPVILILTGYALWLGEARRDPAIRIEAEARMWEWRFRYPGTDLADSIDVLHLPAGRDVEIVVTSPDVIHSFWIPRLGGKIDAIPGHANRIVLRADGAGDYGGVCAEYCGTGHIDMSFTAIAHPEWPPEAP